MMILIIMIMERNANKYSSNMKEEILDIAKKLYHNHLTPETATNLLLDLFAVSNSVCLHEPQYQSYNNETKLQICDKCGAITN